MQGQYHVRVDRGKLTIATIQIGHEIEDREHRQEAAVYLPPNSGHLDGVGKIVDRPDLSHGV